MLSKIVKMRNFSFIIRENDSMKFIKRIILFIILMGMTPLSDMGFVYAESSEEQKKEEEKEEKEEKIIR